MDEDFQELENVEEFESIIILTEEDAEQAFEDAFTLVDAFDIKSDKQRYRIALEVLKQRREAIDSIIAIGEADTVD